ncbi:MAG: helix-turn-helix domain-containing protein [Sarcina sp.]
MSSIARKLTNRTYVDHLYSKEIDGYIQVMQLKNKKIVEIKNYRGMTIADALEEYTGKKDTFISVNTSYNGRRLASNTRQFRALYIDLDHKEFGFNDLVYRTWDLVNENKIPEPTMVVASGRGAHIYWRIEHAPYQAIATWQELEDYLCYQLKHLGADKKATDAARVLRLPDTLNSRNNAECKVMIVNEDITYSMYELREKYLKWKPKVFKEIKIKENKKEFKVLQFFTSYTLHMARMQDLETLCKIRKYRVTGYRNIILHCYAYWIGVTTRDSDNLKEAVNELNNKFTQPMKQTEVDAILRCVPKAIDKFLAYEQGLRSGEVKRVSKGMRDKGGYWYKNETLIERLDITIAEQKQLKTIIGREVKYDRRRAKDNESKRAKRRNEDGLTKKQLEMRELKVKVLELKEQGMSLRKIAKEVGKAKGTIENILKK